MGMRGAALAAGAITVAGLWLPGVAPGDPQQDASTPPTVANGRSSARHVCQLSGGFRGPDGGWVVADVLPCTRIYAPLLVHVGDRLRVGTPAEATAVTIRSVRPPASPRRGERCARQAAGRWICRMPSARRRDREIWLNIDYPNAFSSWSVDVAVRSRARLSVRGEQVDNGKLYIEGFVQCLAIRRADQAAPFFHRCFSSGLQFERLLRPGGYRVASYTRPCDGNCGYLDPPRNHCARELRLRGGQRLRALVRFAVEERCRIGLHRASPAPRRITLGSLGVIVRAPIGNACGVQRNGGTICTAVYFPGHPARPRLPVARGGALAIRTGLAARAVSARLGRRVERGGAVDVLSRQAIRARPSAVAPRGRRWRLRLPRRYGRARAISVVVRYRNGELGQYYAPIRPVRR